MPELIPRESPFVTAEMLMAAARSSFFIFGIDSEFTVNHLRVLTETFAGGDVMHLNFMHSQYPSCELTETEIRDYWTQLADFLNLFTDATSGDKKKFVAALRKPKESERLRRF